MVRRSLEGRPPKGHRQGCAGGGRNCAFSGNLLGLVPSEEHAGPRSAVPWDIKRLHGPKIQEDSDVATDLAVDASAGGDGEFCIGSAGACGGAHHPGYSAHHPGPCRGRGHDGTGGQSPIGRHSGAIHCRCPDATHDLMTPRPVHPKVVIRVTPRNSEQPADPNCYFCAGCRRYGVHEPGASTEAEARERPRFAPAAIQIAILGGSRGREQRGKDHASHQ